MAYPFPRAAAEKARARWDELAPYFIVEKRDARAYRPLVRASHCNAERAQDLFGDDAVTGASAQ